ncbi:hypothetical protein Acr_22g0008820 [Actinidia rufa]|uniref:Uncharacterized protein n=1 Tax=Actinidia rufa TaxID=165716 RepID=A0A7J0GLA5_9ERIC|nr:hypothetical protein Acr_22g0008820 [Actinidia rufa]
MAHERVSSAWCFVTTLPKLNDYVLCRIRKKDDGKKQNVSKHTEEAIGGNQDGEVFGSVSYAKNSIIGRKRPRPNLSAADAAMPNLSVADAADARIMVELIAQEEPRIDKEGDQRMDRLGFGTEEVIGGKDGEVFGSVSCAENPIIGRKRPRPNLSVADAAMPNLSVGDAADAPIMVESFAQEEPRIDKEGDQRMDRLGAENCVPALSEGISKSFTQDDYAEIFGDRKMKGESIQGLDLWNKEESGSNRFLLEMETCLGIKQAPLLTGVQALLRDAQNGVEPIDQPNVMQDLALLTQKSCCKKHNMLFILSCMKSFAPIAIEKRALFDQIHRCRSTYA